LILSNFISKIQNKLHLAFLKLFRHPWEGYKYRKRAQLTDEDIFPKNAKYYLGIVAIFRGEDDYLVEWVEFHKMMGVEHFIMYDNGLEESSKKILQPYIDDGIVTQIPFPNVEGLRDGRHADTLNLQQLAYADCIIRFREHFHYLLQLDLDEFMFPKKHNNIREVLKQFDTKSIARIEVNWTNFGNNNHIAKPNGLVIQNFTKSGKTIVHDTVKSISSTKYLSNFFKYTNVHRFSLRISLKDFFTKRFFNYPKIVKNDDANNLLQLNHYIIKSKEEYLQKAHNFQDGWQVGKKTEELFDTYSEQYNKKTDLAIQRFLPKLIKNIDDY